MKVLINFITYSVHCIGCANKLNLQVTKDQYYVETWDKLDFQHVYCSKCEIEVYEGTVVNGQHLAMFVYD